MRWSRRRFSPSLIGRHLADLELMVRMVIWAYLLAILKHVLPLPQLVRLVATGKCRGAAPRGFEDEIVWRAHRVCRVCFAMSQGRCLERSLIAYRFLAKGGTDPRLVVGMRKADDQWIGHTWVVVEGRPIGEAAAELHEFTTLLAFDAAGKAEVVL
jgi:hypothetical protein